MVEVITPCPTCYGKWNPPRTGAKMVENLKNKGKELKLGVVARRERPELTKQIVALQGKAGWTGGGEKA